MARPGKSEESNKHTRKRGDQAWQDKLYHQSMMEELYRYALPNRRPVDPRGRGPNTASAPKAGNEQIVDPTGMIGGVRFANSLQRGLTPVHQEFIAIEPSPIIPEKERQGRAAQLVPVSKMAQAIVDASNYAMASHEMYWDLAGGNGAMLMLDGEGSQLLVCQSVPTAELAIDEGPHGRVELQDWKRSFKPRVIERMWPSGKFSDKFNAAKTNKPEDPITIRQITEYDPVAKRWIFSASEDDGGQVIDIREYRTCPWLTPRYFKVPGEIYGRGVLSMALPFIKSLNTAQVMTLKAMAFAMLGLYTRVDDGVFNPATARLAPGAMLTVARNGGPLGPSIQPLPVASNFQASQLATSELREQIKQILVDDTIPPLSGSVRSPTEIMERMRRLTQDHAGAFPRLKGEIVDPLVARVLDVAEERKVLPLNVSLDPLLTSIVIKSPLARAQSYEDMMAIIESVMFGTQMLGPEGTFFTYDLEFAAREVARLRGADPRLVRTPEASAALQKQAAAAVAAKMAPPEPAPSAIGTPTGAAI